MVFVLRPLTQTQQTEGETDQEYKHKSRLVIYSNFAAWGEHSTTTTDLDVKKATYDLREAPRLWQKERDQKVQELEFRYNDKLAHLVQSHIHPSLWFIAEGAVSEHNWIPPFDHYLQSDE